MKKYYENVKDYLSYQIERLDYILNEYKVYSIDDFENLIDELDNMNIISLLRYDRDKPSMDSFLNLLYDVNKLKQNLIIMDQYLGI